MQLLDAFELSRLTMKTVKQNLWWAFAYNMVSSFATNKFIALFMLSTILKGMALVVTCNLIAFTEWLKSPL